MTETRKIAAILVADVGRLRPAAGYISLEIRVTVRSELSSQQRCCSPARCRSWRGWAKATRRRSLAAAGNRSCARPNWRSGMPFLIGRSLSRGHERFSLDAMVSTFHSLSKVPPRSCGAIAFVAAVALGMSGPASAANLAVSYSATGELADPDSNLTPIDVQNTASDSTAGKSRSVSLKLNNKTFSTVGAAGDAFASAHAAYGELRVDAFASGFASVFHAEVGFTTEATASFSDAFTFGWNDPKNFGKPVVVQSNILLDGGFTHSNVYEASTTFPPHGDYVSSGTISELFLA